MAILKQGFHDAIILRCDTTNKYEIVVAYGYDVEESQNMPCDTSGICSGSSCPYYFSVCNK